MKDEIENLKKQVEGLKLIIKMQKEELWKLRLCQSELTKANNLLQGYKKVIEDLGSQVVKK